MTWMTDGCGFVIYRYVDRDMFMRHLGQGIGHPLSSTPAGSDVPVTGTTNLDAQTPNLHSAEDNCSMQVDEDGAENQESDQDDQDDQEDHQEEEDTEAADSDSESESSGSDCDSDIYDDL